MSDTLTRPASNGRDSVEPGRIVFMASLPPTLGAISFDGRGDGARLRLDIPRSDTGAMTLLSQVGAGKMLKVTIEVIL
ncbi:MAG: hypothetical protein ACYTBJ_14925 [Planctomycetota bacterium]